MQHAIISTSSGSDVLAELGRKLVSQGMKVVTTTSPAHECLLNASVSHEHALRGGSARISEHACLVVGSLSNQALDPEQQAIQALLRTAALDPTKYAVLVDPSHYPLAHKGFQGIDLETRKHLASYALRHLSSRDQDMADRLSGLDAPAAAKVLVVGGGGREHAIAWKLAQSKHVSQVVMFPGSPGISGPKIKCLADYPASDYDAIVRFAKEQSISLVAIGPEQPLVDGLSDMLHAAGIPCFGPSGLAARLEGSKAFSKDFMKRHAIPTAKYCVFTDFAAAVKHVETVSYPVVIKASGLAAGKGVVLPETVEEAREALKMMMLDSTFGDAGSEVVIEERLEGEEVSVLAFCDGSSAVLMPAAQDHKRVFDNDQGPNTGGMGAYAPAPALPPPLQARVYFDVIQKTIDGCRKEGFPFVGVLYAGLIITSEGPKVLEFNCRFGDPETQIILPLLDSDLFQVMHRCVAGRLLAAPVEFASNAASACVVLASKGYPGTYQKGETIQVGELPEGVQVFFAGVSKSPSEGVLTTSGGRVLAVTCRGDKLDTTLQRIYTVLDDGLVTFSGVHFRRDIGQKALRPPLRIGVLGSTRGTDLQYIIDAIEKGWLRAEIKLVISNKKDAYIVTRAQDHGLPTIVHSMKGCATRAEFDAKVTASLREAEVDLVLLIGYMRILSEDFVKEWYGRVLNVHPSLLPEFAGGMDLNVHQAVIDAKRDVTGCTIHLVTEEVDGGPIIIQRRCPVLADDNSDTLKERVQAMEGPAFVDAIFAFVKNGLKFP